MAETLCSRILFVKRQLDNRKWRNGTNKGQSGWEVWEVWAEIMKKNEENHLVGGLEHDFYDFPYYIYIYL